MNLHDATARQNFDINSASPDEIAEALAEIALSAGPAILEVYAEDFDSRAKSDGSPVTEADHRAEAIILGALKRLAPETPTIAEEAVAAGQEVECGDQFFLVDPLDGTREFLKRNGEFTVNVALVRSGTPIAGAVYAPAQNQIWFGGDRAWTCSVSAGSPLAGVADRRLLKTRPAPSQVDGVGESVAQGSRD